MTAAPHPWLEPVFRRLLARLAADRLPHALLLTGPTGIGKLALAEALAGAAMCTDRGPAGDACGVCRSCRLHRAGTHPDQMHLTIPEDKTRIVVDQIRELAEGMGLSRSVGAHRVAVVWPADAMNVSAANSLLKTLEEPPPDSLLILVTAEPSRLPATIRSRCQIESVPMPDETAARAWLADQGVGGDADVLMRLARGAPLTARDLADQDAVTRWRALVEDLAALCTGRRGIVALAERWNGEDAARLIHWIQIALWECTRQGFTGQGQSGDLQALAKTLDLRQAFHLQDRLAEWRRLARTTVNQQLLLEEVFAGLAPGRR
jgi:DNA polymerase III subunit delta'